MGTRTIKTKKGDVYNVRVTYEVVAVKASKVPKGTVVARGRYTTEAATLRAARQQLTPKKKKKVSKADVVNKQYQKQEGHKLEHTTQLKNFSVQISRKRLPQRAQVGGLFVFTYQLNGKTIIHDKVIESFSRRTTQPVTSLSAQQIAAKLREAQEFARVRFLQEVGLETANIVNEEFIPPVVFKYYV